MEAKVGKQISDGWQDAIGMLPHCTIMGSQVGKGGGQLILTLKDPAGQVFALAVEGQPVPVKLSVAGVEWSADVQPKGLRIGCFEVHQEAGS